ncbi:fimbrial protein [Pseudoduganella sp. R-31]|uniref:fimbrial protein n=1 Tax=unclassified Pseudoduganella TaxID=2637179 RepID=UPI003CF52685
MFLVKLPAMWRRFAVGLGLVVASFSAHATCTLISPPMQPLNKLMLPAFGTDDDSFGSSTSYPMKLSFHCDKTTLGVQVYYQIPFESTDGGWAWKTGIPGIGMILRDSEGNIVRERKGLLFDTSTIIDEGGKNFDKTFSIQLTRWALGATSVVGDVSSEVMRFTDKWMWKEHDAGAWQFKVKFVRPTCTAQVSQSEVRLNEVRASDLSTIGSEAGETPFQVRLLCYAGAEPSIYLSDANGNGKDGDLLTPAAGSEVKGVQLRIARDGKPVRLGGPGNKWSLGRIANTWHYPQGPVQIPLSVRYVATGKVTPGIIRSMATFTITYD